MRSKLPLRWCGWPTCPGVCAICGICGGARVPDYKIICPDKWTEDPDHYCVSPDSYAGPCVGKKRLRVLLRRMVSHRFTCVVSRSTALSTKRRGVCAHAPTDSVYRSCCIFGGAACGVDWPDHAPARGSAARCSFSPTLRATRRHMCRARATAITSKSVMRV